MTHDRQSSTPAGLRRLPWRGILAAASIAVAATGCVTVGPDYEAPETVVADQWHQELVGGLKSGQADVRTWWTSMDDPRLDSLIARAGEGNLDLKSAAARIREARAQLGIATGERYPNVDGLGSAARVGSSEGLGTGGTNNVTAIGGDASWELDFWGRVRRSIESAEASYEASVENYRDVLVVLYAEVGSNYVLLRALHERLRLAIANVDLQRETLKLVQARNRAELAPDLDVRQAELNLASTESVIPSLRAAIVQTINRLGVLLGLTPDALHKELSGLGVQPELVVEVAAGIPADTVRRRPDVRRAERVLAAQTARVGLATTALYPNFFLTGDFGFATASGSLLDGDNKTWSVGPLFTWNLFDGGRVRNAIEVEDARTEQALADYEQTVLLAIEDVENSMVAFVEERQRNEALVRSVDAASEADRLVRSLYKSGLTNFQNVLDTQRALFNQQDLLADSTGQVYQNLILVYRALGGGWDPDAQ